VTSLEAALGPAGAARFWKTAGKSGRLARLGAGALGLGLGTAAGVLAGELADRAGGPMPLRALLRAAPLLGAGLGISLAMARHSAHGEGDADR
jgi:hypothetical protein